MQKITKNLELVPHITLDPTDERLERRQVEVEALSRYWATNYSHLNIDSIYRFEGKWWIIPIRYVTDERTIHELLTVVVHDILEEELNLDTIMMSIYGGLSLFHRDTLIYEAECCADLTNIEDWQNILTYRDHDWTLMWNGHPMMPVRYYGGLLYFAELNDYIPKSRNAVKYAIPVDILTEAVKQASDEVTQFKQRLNDYWTRHKDEILG